MKEYFKRLFGKKPAEAPKPERQASAGNPGYGSFMNLTLNNKVHRIDLPGMLAEALQAEGVNTVREGDWLLHPPTGYAFLVQMVDIQDLLDQLVNNEGERLQTTTTIEIFHPVLFPNGCFEYQHSFAYEWMESLQEGLAQWVALDWPTLRDAIIAPEAEKECSVMQMAFPAEDGAGEHKANITLGKVWHYQANPPEVSDEEHDFCPCCLFTQTLNRATDDYMALLQDDKSYAIRYFASRDDDGNISADCRINGEDWQAGKDALCAYVETWPDGGLEFRKQYVLISKSQDE